MTTREDIERHERSGTWRQLEQLALQMIDDAQANAGSKMNATLGGGTRLMLALHHRISDDIDIFLRDPQWLGYLTPRLNDRFEDEFTGYDEGASTLKLRLPDGEIDFIVGMRLLGDRHDETSPLTPFTLEPLDEVLAKKLFYRGWALTPRDLFDWRALVESGLLLDYEAIGCLVQGKVPEIELALAGLKASQAAHAIWAAIKAADKPDLDESIEWAQAELAMFAALQCDRRPGNAPMRERPQA